MSGLTLMVADGPCEGSYDAMRATPRMVFVVDRFTGQRAALDEDGDTIEATEDAYVYETDGVIGFACGRGSASYRWLVYRYAGALDKGTGEFLPADERMLAALRKTEHQRMLAWARGDAPAVTAPPPTREAAPQGALFT